MFVTFSPEELEALRRFDAEIDAAPMEYEDFLISDFVEALLFPDREPEQVKRRGCKRREYEQHRERYLAYNREYRATHQEAEKARKRAWYQANRERVLAQQQDYRRRRSNGPRSKGRG